jgi:hypothetical protein
MHGMMYMSYLTTCTWMVTSSRSADTVLFDVFVVHKTLGSAILEKPGCAGITSGIILNNAIAYSNNNVNTPECYTNA